jgi:hypothetical protein
MRSMGSAADVASARREQAGWCGRLGSRCRNAAGATPAVVDRADTVEWLGAPSAQARPGVATVVFHSIVLLYLTPEARAKMMEILHAAASKATPGAPLAWLSMEPNRREDDILLTLWPGRTRTNIRSTNIICFRPG